jgi:hypothetical protein
MVIVLVELEEAGVEAEPEGLVGLLVAAESTEGRESGGALIVFEGVEGELGEESPDAGQHGGGAIEFSDEGEFGLREVERHDRRIKKWE